MFQFFKKLVFGECNSHIVFCNTVNYEAIYKLVSLIVGHRAARYGVIFDKSRAPDDDTIFYGKGMIAIDSATRNSRTVNVLVLRGEEVPTPVTHEMKLLPQYFEAVKSGRKTVEMRLYDKKRQSIRSGDKITFTNTENGEKITVTVTGLY